MIHASPIAQIQRDITDAILQPDAPVPAQVYGCSEAQRAKRFNVYRNNVHVSLTSAIAARFPVVQRIVGEAFFRAMALAFVRLHPPASPVLAEYGASFADFLDDFDPVAELPYLPDVARLEWARNVAYHAADAESVSIDALAAIPIDLLEHSRLVLHPATRWIGSPYPIVSIWRTNTYDESVNPIGAEADGELALVTRPGLDVLVTAMPVATASMLQALARGADLGAAVHDDLQDQAGLDLAATLAALFAAGAVERVKRKGER